MIDFNEIKKLLVNIANEHGLSCQMMQDGWNEERERPEWALEYTSDLSDALQNDIRGLMGYARICDLARQDGDLLAMRVALIYMRIYAMNVGQTFDALAEDVAHLELLEHNRPGGVDMPERYTFSDRYRKACPDLHFDS